MGSSRAGKVNLADLDLAEKLTSDDANQPLPGRSLVRHEPPPEQVLGLEEVDCALCRMMFRLDAIR